MPEKRLGPRRVTKPSIRTTLIGNCELDKLNRVFGLELKTEISELVIDFDVAEELIGFGEAVGNRECCFQRSILIAGFYLESMSIEIVIGRDNPTQSRLTIAATHHIELVRLINRQELGLLLRVGRKTVLSLS